MTKFYSAKYFLQYINNSTINKLNNISQKSSTVVHIVQNDKNNDAHTSWKL